MSDSTNINNELDQYGVWVKNPPHTESLEDSLPDFSFLENTAAQDEQLTFENDDTALSADELLNITNSISTEEVAEETPAPEATDEVSLDDFMSDDFSILNVCAVMGTPYKSVGTAGIKKVEKWNYQCTGCLKWYKEKQDECPICGSPMRAHRKKR